MSLLLLLLLLLLGGVVAWLAERMNPGAPRWVALIVSALGLVYLFVLGAARPPDDEVSPDGDERDQQKHRHRDIAWHGRAMRAGRPAEREQRGGGDGKERCGDPRQEAHPCVPIRPLPE